MLIPTHPRRAQTHAAQIDDAAALETDTMRFLAIMSICLMAIFALIESIPETGQEVGVAVAQTPANDLTDDAKEVAARIQQLRHRAGQLVAYIDNLVQQAEQGQQVLQARYTNARARTIMVEQRLATQEAKLQRVTARLQRVEQAQHQDRSERELQRTRKAVATEEQQLTLIRKAVDPQSAVSKTPAAPEAPKEKASTEPLTLRFDSTSALETLVTGRKLRLFARLGNKTWLASTTLGFTPGEVPDQTYRVTGSVGDALADSFKRQAGLITFRSPQWLVAFNDQLASRIAVMVQQHKHGSLVIGAAGRVVHEP